MPIRLVDNRQIVFIKRGALDGNNGRRGSAGPTGLMILIVRLDGQRRAFGDRSARCIFGKQPDRHDFNFNGLTWHDPPSPKALWRTGRA